MDVNRLLGDELRYELYIRGQPSNNTVADNRARIREVFRSEWQGDMTHFPKVSLYFYNELEICSRKLEELQQNIDDFDQNNRENKYRRIYSRLLHISGRSNRLSGKDVGEEISRLRVCGAVSSDLVDIGEPPSSPTVEPPPTQYEQDKRDRPWQEGSQPKPSHPTQYEQERRDRPWQEGSQPKPSHPTQYEQERIDRPWQEGSQPKPSHPTQYEQERRDRPWQEGSQPEPSHPTQYEQERMDRPWQEGSQPKPSHPTQYEQERRDRPWQEGSQPKPSHPTQYEQERRDRPWQEGSQPKPSHPTQYEQERRNRPWQEESQPKPSHPTQYEQKRSDRPWQEGYQPKPSHPTQYEQERRYRPWQEGCQSKPSPPTQYEQERRDRPWQEGSQPKPSHPTQYEQERSDRLWQEGSQPKPSHPTGRPGIDNYEKMVGETFQDEGEKLGVQSNVNCRENKFFEWKKNPQNYPRESRDRAANWPQCGYPDMPGGTVSHGKFHSHVRFDPNNTATGQDLRYASRMAQVHSTRFDEDSGVEQSGTQSALNDVSRGPAIAATEAQALPVNPATIPTTILSLC
ncbi:unnamed protein product [Phaedon cochleariae]|uniref:Uncharacterized protein n=1 Tax=Phaedon cochleariae TaxID=80249 RepID=A0A9N9SIC3_PHACE|nr:unnamed protein product [Phaedon cochleariae]